MPDSFILIGHPVGHSLSPAIHRAAYEALGLDAEYHLVDCADEDAVRVQVSKIKTGEIKGANVTIPWKQIAYDCADVHAETARDVGACNVLSLGSGGEIVAHNTDASALAAELKKVVADLGAALTTGPAALIIGTGGAALAAAVACKRAGCRRVTVTGRRMVAGVSPTVWPHAREWERLCVTPCAWPSPSPEALKEVLSTVDLIVQATSAGMKGAEGGEQLAQVFPWSGLSRRVAVYDLVYTPKVTPFLRRAEQEGHLARGGLGMLVGQAAFAIQIWTGQQPPLASMTRAAEEALGL